MSHAVFVDTLTAYFTFLNSNGLHRRIDLTWKNNLGKRIKKGEEGERQVRFLEWNERIYGGVKSIIISVL